MTPEERAVQAAAGRVARAREGLGRAVQEARDAGISLRRIGAQAGLSQEHVRRLTTAAPPPSPESLDIDTTKDGWLAEYPARVDLRRFRGAA